ncbi:glycosyltransferase family 4 protein [Bifidobacterium angulatum]|uniref:glycosyltransferase family 4 protein n=1 Tax=Bifidobacterium angulatum TaxID=1683 RepID=UPI0034A2C97B
MKIAFIGHKRIPSREGGIEIVVDELATRMVDRGHQVIAYNRSGHNVAGSEFDGVANGHGKRFSYHGVNVVSVPTIEGKGLAALSSSFFATLQAIKAKPDVIHYHAEGPCVMLRLAHWAGIRTVATIHGLDWQRAKWGKFASMYLKLGERTAARCADEVIVLSRGVQEYFQRTYGRSTRLIPNGIEPVESVAADLIAKKWGLAKGSYVLFLGRIVPEKGVHYLIDAFKRLDTGKRLVIAGGASDSAEYYESVRKAAGSDPRIVLAGFTQGAELAELYSNAYAYVLPSDLEGMPMSLLEALSYGNCCLTSDIPECADVLKGENGVMHGVTFRQGDVDDLAARLRELLDHPDTVAAFGKDAAAYVTGRYNWDKVVQATLKLYRGADK